MKKDLLSMDETFTMWRQNIVDVYNLVFNPEYYNFII